MRYFSLIPECCIDLPQEAMNKCGSLFPFITTLTGARRYAKSVKKQFPNITFNLLEGKTWGESRLIEQF